MARTKLGSQIESGQAVVALVGGACSGTCNVFFQETFAQAPQVLVVNHLGDEGASFTATEITDSKFKLTCSGSGLPDGNVTVEWVAHQKT